jgi:hypothetical protein
LITNKFSKQNILKFPEGLFDRTIILIDNKEVAIIGYNDREIVVNISEHSFDEKKSIHDLEIMVENEGRYNFGIVLMNAQHKGITEAFL